MSFISILKILGQAVVPAAFSFLLLAFPAVCLLLLHYPVSAQTIESSGCRTNPFMIFINTAASL
jgi:hypothetical protein